MTKVTPIDKAVVLKCSPATRKIVAEYADKTGISMRRIVDDAIEDWMSTVGQARLEALTKQLSQNENSA